MDSSVSRRRFVRAVSAGGALAVSGAFAGCSDSGGNKSGDVVAGPNAENRFDPERLTVSVGDTVTWSFDSAGHNVCAIPEDNGQVELPEGAAPFASYDDGEKFSTIERGGTFEHTFETAGTYTYVCIPHATQGMVGTVVVEE